MSDVHAAIDIGTNSIHLLVARVTPEGFDVIASEKETVRLGSGLGRMRRLSTDAIDRGVAALTRMGQLAVAAGADISAVATSAVREADNADDFIDRVRAEAGVEVDVISGREEARLIHLGVLQALPVFDHKLLMIDIGGGSTELLVGRGYDVADARSIRLGAIRLTDGFFPGGAVTADAVAEARTWLRNYLVPARRALQPLGHEVAVGSSGTIETLATIALRAAGESVTSIGGAVLTRAALADVVATLLAAPTAEERSSIRGLDPGRADTIVGGALLLEALFEGFAIDQLTVSEYALREGVFLDRYRSEHGMSFGRLHDIRLASVERLAGLFREDRDHVAHSTDLALQLFDDTRPIHGRGATERNYLEAAGWLHNVGLFISHAAHHKHSYYVIRNSDQLVGFTDREVEIIAQVARYHRKSPPKETHENFRRLRPDDQYIVCLLAGLLRIGIALDRSHDGRVTDVEAQVDDNAAEVDIQVTTRADASLELFTARSRCHLAADTLAAEIRFADVPEL